MNLSTVKIKVDGTTYTTSSTGMVSKGITNGYQFTFTPQTALKDGSHTITINASDNDGNAAAAVSSTFTIDTVPPTLTISSPAAGLITNKAALNVTGKTNDAGTVVTKDATDATLGESLRLIVKETMKPAITLVSPSKGAYVTNNKQPITFKVVDEAGGSAPSDTSYL